MVIGAAWAGARAFTPTAGPGHLADERVHRPGLLRRSAGGDLRRAAHRAVDRHADAHAAGRPDDVRLRVARRHAPHLPLSGRSARSVRVRGQGVRSRRALPDAGVRAERSRHRHERLDGAEADVGRQLPARPRQGAVGRGARAGEDASTATSTSTATASPTARCRACTRRARTSRAAPATTASAATPRTPTSTPRCSIASTARSRAPRAPCRRRSSGTQPGAKMGLVTVGGCHAACIEALDLLAQGRRRRSTTCASAGSRSATRCATFLDAHDVNFVVEQNRDGQLRSLLMLETGVPVDEARVGALLRRVPDERAPRDRRREGQAARRRHDLHRQTQGAPPVAAEERDRADPPRLRRRDHDAVRRLRPRLDHRGHHPGVLGAVDSRRTAWPSCRASAARRRRRPTSCARRTASTACTAACRRSPPAPTPPTATLIYIGVSGDGDSLSIGLGQLCHAIRRNVNLLYVLENNGVYGLTKGQFSASADPGSTSKKGEANTMEAIDGVLLALTLGATFVARSFSGDKAQLVPILKAGLAHNGLRVHRRDLALRHLQRSRGLDQELRLHARAQRRGRAGRLRAAGRRDHGRLRRRAPCRT